MSPANFTSGWLGNGERAWHGQGVVTEGTLPAREAFETADALFTVEKRELSFPTYSTVGVNEANCWSNTPSGAFGLVRTDTQDLLGIVSKRIYTRQVIVINAVDVFRLQEQL